MKLMRLALALGLVLGLGACSVFQTLGTGLANTGAAIGDQFVPSAAQAPIANTAAAAENFYTGSVKSLTVANDQRVITIDQMNRLDALEGKVYAALVTVRTDVEQGKDVTAALAVFNAAYGNLFTEAKTDGVTLSTTGGAP